VALPLDPAAALLLLAATATRRYHVETLQAATGRIRSGYWASAVSGELPISPAMKSHRLV
jgi:hypothetical protein